MLRIIGGEYRSRQLQTPPDDAVTRPYPHRVKEAVFNLLRGWFEGARVLDLFAGVGSMGLEAASRGADRVVMVERDKLIARLLKANIETLGCGDRAEAVLGDALGPLALASAPSPVDIVFIDPPYAMLEDAGMRGRVLEQVRQCASVMQPRGFVILRSPCRPDADEFTVPGMAGPEVHDYGGRGMWVLLYQPETADAEQGASADPRTDEPA